MTLLGKAVHISIDLVLVSTCLAGIRRNTGLTVKLDNVQDNFIKDYTEKLLNVGESAFDYAVAYCGSSSSFQRK
ncbi:AFR298Cp [Eremothecium gossypii ATCC 10895]|uniref:AFR298Cp n=1 Tax=Eremothecium gossypii (strain ATCC 10895 / CBS 109.51 / FGSC 9923 / NRRL Y-1056) TaxID=284811 RepID=Q753L4_EREGS|nr:AFR298Cp [Eremothecium gossypii ATCC 10895]AAS53669.1 AFR298Cp [Eremothecium gossypii ATCC 10895]AEY97982.1 FAFR298Cp [Eremothecium gossypii FDAG1]